ncbi:MAG: tRNA-guanine transglycosylase DpdA [Candidatus Thorarchaeota archaeon]|nr:MAG: queuine/other tRNA-ribosyltransferase [Candidatus Thorarchaeota archaeon]RLI59172.1 MAG: queuine/other tRNA-ribosyltransferase [Candidatus Thorarchaeota archaeon]
MTDDKPMLYFIPWWDDFVDLNYDFIHDEPTDGIKVTSHQIYERAPYDGILASKMKIEDNMKTMTRIESVGIHEYLGFDGPVFGDCGAYGYIKEDMPPISTNEIADYYQRLGFDYGVSVDHLIVKSTEDQKHRRFELTLKNAEEFIQRHESKGYDYVPVGAAQGWDPASYKSATKSLLDMGYEYIAVGGLTRSQTPVVLAALNGVHEAILKSKRRVRVHLFGVARLNAIGDLLRLGVTSFDSASHLRRAWLGAGSNYILPGGRGYAAIRVPQWNRSPRAKEILQSGYMSEEELESMDTACMDLIRMYDKGEADIDEVLEAVLWYDSILGDKRDHADAYKKTLTERPWKQCSCAICRQVGIEVIVFRGNNRNRRRGFHNTYVFYHDLQRTIADELSGGQQTRLTDFE